MEPGQAEVGDPELAPVIDHEVGRLDIAVDDPLLVGVLERLGGLEAKASRGADEAAAPARGLLRSACRGGFRRRRQAGHALRTRARSLRGVRAGDQSTGQRDGEVVDGRRAGWVQAVELPQARISSARDRPSMNCMA